MDEKWQRYVPKRLRPIVIALSMLSVAAIWLANSTDAFLKIHTWSKSLFSNFGQVSFDKWDDEKAIQYVTRQTLMASQEVSGDLGGDPSNVSFGTDGPFSVEYLNGASSKILLGSFTELQCFARTCARVYSVFEFRKSEPGWLLVLEDHKAFSVGEFGQEPDEIRIIEIGSDHYAIGVSSSYLNKGISGGYTTLISKIGGHYTEIFHEESQESRDPMYNISLSYESEKDAYTDDRYHGWTATVEVIRDGSRRFYDVRMRRSGTYSDSLRLMKQDEQSIYTFDGKGYSKSLGIR